MITLNVAVILMASSPSAPASLKPHDSLPSDTSTREVPITASWVIMTVVATIAVGLRLYARAFIIKATGTDDWLILTALVGSPSGCA